MAPRPRHTRYPHDALPAYSDVNEPRSVRPPGNRHAAHQTDHRKYRSAHRPRLSLRTLRATKKRAKQSPHGERKEREGHAADPPSPRPKKRRQQYWRPSRPRIQRAARSAARTRLIPRETVASEPASRYGG